MNPIPFIDLKAQQARLRGRIDAAIARVLDHGQYILGPDVGLFEEELARFTGARHVVSCANGTDALTLVHLAEDVGPGDAVFAPSMTFVATVEPCCCAGRPRSMSTSTRGPSHVTGRASRKHIRAPTRAGLRPRLVIPVDLYGLPADYDAIMEFAAGARLWLSSPTRPSPWAHGAATNSAPAPWATTPAPASFLPSPSAATAMEARCFTDDAEAAAAVAVDSLPRQGPRTSTTTSA